MNILAQHTRALPFCLGLAGLVAFAAPGHAATALCAPHFVGDLDQVICAVANYGAAREVTIRMRDGRDGALVEPRLTVTIPRFGEAGVHHNVVPPDPDVTAPAHPVICHVTGVSSNNMRVSFTRLAGAAAVDEDRLPVDFTETIAANGGESFECR